MQEDPHQPKREEIRVELPLSTAWWELGDPWAKATYRVAEGGFEGRQALMQIDLIGALHDGVYEAIGYMISPEISNERKIIPKYLFEEPDIDWEKSALRAYGYVYEGVRVVAARYVSGAVEGTVIETVDPTSINWVLHREPTIRPKRRRLRDKQREPIVEENKFGPLSRSGSEAASDKLVAERLPSRPKRAPPSEKMGRKSIEPELDQVVRLLDGEQRLLGIPQTRQEDRVRERAQSLYPSKFPPPRPSRGPILRALKKAGF